MEDVDNVFIEDVEDENYYPDWMDKYLKHHILYD
jgi:hypothetical protein